MNDFFHTKIFQNKNNNLNTVYAYNKTINIVKNYSLNKTPYNKCRRKKFNKDSEVGLLKRQLDFLKEGINVSKRLSKRISKN